MPALAPAFTTGRPPLQVCLSVGRTRLAGADFDSLGDGSILPPSLTAWPFRHRQDSAHQFAAAWASDSRKPSEHCDDPDRPGPGYRRGDGRDQRRADLRRHSPLRRGRATLGLLLGSLIALARHAVARSGRADGQAAGHRSCPQPDHRSLLSAFLPKKTGPRPKVLGSVGPAPA